MLRTARIDAEPQVLRWFLEIDIARLRFLAFQPQIRFEMNFAELLISTESPDY